jgi:CHRD domain
MKTLRFRLAAAVGVIAALAVAVVAIAAANGGGHGIREKLSGYQENPALSTTGHGKFRLTIDRKAQEIHYVLTYGGLESPATQSHIHFEKKTNNGAIVVFLCSNLGNGPPGTQACPASGGTISGTIRPADVTAMAAAQGIAAGEFDEFVQAIKVGATYVNVHSVDRPGGEIRAQLVRGNHDKDKHH